MTRADSPPPQARRGKGQTKAARKEATVTAIYTIAPYPRSPGDIVQVVLAQPSASGSSDSRPQETFAPSYRSCRAYQQKQAWIISCPLSLCISLVAGLPVEGDTCWEAVGTVVTYLILHVGGLPGIDRTVIVSAASEGGHDRTHLACVLHAPEVIQHFFVIERKREGPAINGSCSVVCDENFSGISVAPFTIIRKGNRTGGIRWRGSRRGWR